MTSTKVLGIQAETPRGEDDTEARYRWTKFTLATHIRVDLNKARFRNKHLSIFIIWGEFSENQISLGTILRNTDFSEN